ncbi:MAG: gyrase subunit [Clostridiales bacterium]|nr:gyrase subunit [Clostridiales bacterium]
MPEEEQTKVIEVNLEEEMKHSYIDYAMSVIVGRALPDVRDGLKPVHRRILYAMSELGLTPDKSYRKSARIVGDVLGKYHPHGEAAVYDSMVRMAQDFSMRYPLVDGHGNFGSIDNDPPAAMRYTEARLSHLAMEMLTDIDKETVDFIPNFDETLKEPVVLPSRFPNLLVNGSAGIAVGMATNIPPHNLKETIDAAIKIMDDPDISIDELMKTLKGPDFPTGGIIMGRDGIKQAYHTGRGRIKVRGKTSIEPLPGGRSRIIVTEIPYQVTKADLVVQIANLVKDKRIDGIADIRDESDKEGMRIAIDLKRDVNPNVVLNLLYKHTRLEDTFGIIMLALVDNQPKVLNIKQMFYYYIDHQKDVIVRRSRYDLEKAEARAHILEGLRIALDHIDAIVALIRSSRTVQIAKEGLMTQFNLSDKQAQAILDMRLQRLTGLERDKIEEEYSQIMSTIEYLRRVLADEGMVYKIIKDELKAIRNKYGDDRRTQISSKADEMEVEDLIQDEEVAITLTHFGYIKRLPLDTYKSQRRGGKGITGMQTRDEDFVEHIFVTSTHSYMLFFTNKGKVYMMRAYDVPEAGRQAKGTAIINLLNLSGGEKISAVIPIRHIDDEKYLIMATREGYIKKTSIEEYDNIHKNGLTAIGLGEGDELIGVELTNGKNEVIISTKEGIAIRFPEDNVRPMGRTAHGVKAITLNPGDKVIDMELVDESAELLMVSENGYGKRTPLKEYRSQSRGGKGIITMKITDKTGPLAAIKVVHEDDEIMMITSDGIIIRLEVKGIPIQGRNTQGVTLMKVENGQRIVSLAKFESED